MNDVAKQLLIRSEWPVHGGPVRGWIPCTSPCSRAGQQTLSLRNSRYRRFKRRESSVARECKEQVAGSRESSRCREAIWMQLGHNPPNTSTASTILHQHAAAPFHHDTPDISNSLCRSKENVILLSNIFRFPFSLLQFPAFRYCDHSKRQHRGQPCAVNTLSAEILDICTPFEQCFTVTYPLLLDWCFKTPWAKTTAGMVTTGTPTLRSIDTAQWILRARAQFLHIARPPWRF